MSKIVVFGSYVTDLTARAKKFPEEGETVKGTWFRNGPGGKGSNQAIAARRAGADVALITRLGNDIFGKAALSFFNDEGLDVTGVIVDNENGTGAALIEVNELTAQNRIIVYLGACEHFTDAELNTAEPVIASGGILLTQLETNIEATLEAMRLGKLYGLATVFNPAPVSPLPEGMLAYADYVSVNESEATALTGIPVRSVDDCSEAARRLRQRGAKNVIITLGHSGYYADDGSRSVCGAPLAGVDAVDTTGAGDAFNGAFAAGLAEGMDFFGAAAFGNVAGGIAVTRFGTAPAMPTRAELNEYVRRTSV